MSTGISADRLRVWSLAADPAEPAIVYAATHFGSPNDWTGHFFVTVDGAQQWTEITGSPPFKDIYDIQIDYNQPDKVYVVTSDGNYDWDSRQAPVPTGLYTHTPTFQFKSLTSASSEASDFNSQRKLVRQEYTTNLHAVYHSGNANEHNVYYVSSTDGGTTWSRKILLGQGKHPAVALDDVGNPQVIWLSDNDQKLCYAYNQGGIWSQAVEIYSVAGDHKIGPPAFSAVPAMIGSHGHVVFHWQGTPLGVNVPTAIRYGWLPLNAPGGLLDVVDVDYDDALACLRPSIGYYVGWDGVSLHAAWTKGNQVFYAEKVLGYPWFPPYQVSNGYSQNHDPSLEVYGDNAHIAWVESEAGVHQVTYRYKNLPMGVWIAPERVAYLSSDYGTPQMAAGSYCVWGQGDGEVYHSNRNPFEGWGSPVNWSNTPERSASPQVTFMPWMMGTSLFSFWTENTTAPFQEHFATTIGPLGGFFSLDAGQERASSYTVHRGGYLQYAQRPEKTVDMDGSYLSYRFDRLDPKMLYLVRASYYQETGSPVGLEVKVDGSVFANLAVPNRSVIRGEAWVPKELYADSVVEFVIRKKSGSLGTLGYLELCQAEPKGKGGPQSSELADLTLPKEFSLGAGYPNPMTSEARISYALPKASSVDLTVFNISGQVVRRLVSEPSKTPGRYSVRWDGKNDQGHKVPGGVYFYRLKAGGFAETKKLVVVR